MQKRHALSIAWINMANNIYLDTNIFIDILDNTRPFAKKTLSMVRTFLEEEEELYINSDTVTNAFYVLSKQKRYSKQELLIFMQKIVSLVTVVPLEQNDVMEALALCADKHTQFKDYEDSAQYVCAKKCQAVMIMSNDKSFVSPDIKILTST